MKIAIISNVTAALLAARLSKAHEVVLPDGFGNWIQPCLDPGSNIYRANPEAIFVLLDGGSLFPTEASDETCRETLAFAADAIKTLAKNLPDVMMFIGTIDVPQVAFLPMSDARRERKLENEFYCSIENLIQAHKNIVFFELKKLVEDIGRDAFYDTKMRYLGGMPFSIKALQKIGDEIDFCLKAYSGKRHKVLAVDLDNTLWHGVVGEDGPLGIQLAPEKSGMPYTEFQQRLKELREMGVLLVVLSKNNQADVEEVFSKNKAMILHNDDIAAFSINWAPKPENLINLASELNLGRDSFVFVDDNPAEREAMKAMLPEVAVPEFPIDAAKLPSFIDSVYRRYFLSLRTTDEDRRKTLLYRAEGARQMLREKSASLDSYLDSLQIKVDIHRVRDAEIDRVAQLTQKTNQFNLTTRRYTVHDIGAMAKRDDCIILTAHAKDRFGDNGLIAVLIAKQTGAVMNIDTLLMSCRVMGRTIEHALMNEFEHLAREAGVKKITAEYLPTRKNSPVVMFFEQMGYALVGEHDGVKNYGQSIEKCTERICHAQMEPKQ